MKNEGLAFGDEVVIPWGFEGTVRGTVREVYGPPTRRHVIVVLTPELSGEIVGEPTTVAMPINLVEKVAAAAS